MSIVIIQLIFTTIIAKIACFNAKVAIKLNREGCIIKYSIIGTLANYIFMEVIV